MTDARLERRRRDAQRPQSFFREINDRDAELSRDRDPTLPRFLCECPRVGCCATVTLTLEEYAEVRSDPGRFIVFAGHEDAEIQDVLERRDVCLIIRNAASAGPRPRRARTLPLESRVSP